MLMFRRHAQSAQPAGPDRRAGLGRAASPRRTALAAGTAGLAVVALAATPAVAAAPSVLDVDAELTPGGRLHLQTETRGATSVTFKWAGRSAKGYLTEIDREDGTREYERTVASRGMKPGTRAITVRACGADGCTSRTVRTHVEYDD